MGQWPRGYRQTWLTLCLLASAAVVNADAEMDAAIIRLSSPDKAERHVAAAQIVAWSKAKYEVSTRGFSQAETRRFCDSPSVPSEDEEIPGRCGTGAGIAYYARAYVIARRPDVVRQMLADPKVRIRSRLLHELVKLRDPRDRSIALAFSKSPNPAIRAAGVSALAVYPDDETRRIVLEAARDRKGEVRLAAADALEIWKDEESTVALSTLLGDRFHQVARVAAFSLKGRKSAVAGAAFLHMLASRPTRRWTAIFGLQTNPSTEALPILRTLVGSSDSECEGVISAIAAIDSPQARALVMRLAAGADSDVRHDALSALEVIPSVLAEAVLIETLSDRDETARTIACRALGSRKSAAAIPYLKAIWIKSGKRDRCAENALRDCLGLLEDEEVPEAGSNLGL